MMNGNGTETKKKKNMLFVCTGNTCRSPMAAAMWRQMGGEAASCGLSAPSGAIASDNAVKVMDERGIDLSRHRSEPVTASALRWADAVYVMTENHAARLERMFPSFSGKVRVMPIEVPDPFGGDEDDYRAAAERIREGPGIILREGGR